MLQGVDYDSIGKQVAVGDELVWQGTTWPMSCLSPLCCSTEKWRITQRRIDYEHGCYHNQADTVDLRRVKDLAFRRTPLQLMCGRGTLLVYSDSHLGGEEQKPLSLSRMGARRLYLKLRKARCVARVVSRYIFAVVVLLAACFSPDVAPYRRDL